MVEIFEVGDEFTKVGSGLEKIVLGFVMGDLD